MKLWDLDEVVQGGKNYETIEHQCLREELRKSLANKNKGPYKGQEENQKGMASWKPR